MKALSAILGSLRGFAGNFLLTAGALVLAYGFIRAGVKAEDQREEINEMRVEEMRSTLARSNAGAVGNAGAARKIAQETNSVGRVVVSGF